MTPYTLFVLGWYILGLVSFFIGQYLFEGRLTVGELLMAFIVALIGPVVTFIVIKLYCDFCLDLSGILPNFRRKVKEFLDIRII